MHEYEHSKFNWGGREVVSAWILAAAVLFGLFAFSSAQQVVSNRPDGPVLAERHHCYHTASLSRNLSSPGANRAAVE